jgi:hypothetical protein
MSFSSWSFVLAEESRRRRVQIGFSAQKPI